MLTCRHADSGDRGDSGDSGDHGDHGDSGDSGDKLWLLSKFYYIYIGIGT